MSISLSPDEFVDPHEQKDNESHFEGLINIGKKVVTRTCDQELCENGRGCVRDQ